MDVKAIMNEVAAELVANAATKYKKSVAAIEEKDNAVVELPDNVKYENKRCELKSTPAPKKRRRVTERVLDEVCANLFEQVEVVEKPKPLKSIYRTRRQKSAKRGNKVTFEQLCAVCDNLFEMEQAA